VISLVALFLSIGGVGYAALKITGKDVVDRSLTGKDVKRHSLRAKNFKRGDLPSGKTGPAGPKGDSAPGPEPRTQVSAAPATPTESSCAGDSPPVGQFCADIDDTSQAYNSWHNEPGGYQPAGFFKDGSGIVHIEGTVESLSVGGSGIGKPDPGPTLFVLPVAYRPSATRLFSVYDKELNPPQNRLKVDPDGRVSLVTGARSQQIQLDGIDFRP
jgi:hypothetical protein